MPRKDYIKIYPSIARYFFPKSGIILSHGPQLTTNYFFDTKLNKTDHEDVLTYLITFRSKATFDVIGQNDYVRLLQPFDPTNTGKDSLATGSIHKYNLTGLDFVSAPQHIFTYTASMRYGSYYANGHIFSATGNIGFRAQPYVNISINANYNDLYLPQPWGNTHFWLIGPRVDVTFTNTLFFTTYIQYNQQENNVNINARFQWRYKPASDLFIVYTDNYYPTNFMSKTRALVIKFNYWLSL